MQMQRYISRNLIILINFFCMIIKQNNIIWLKTDNFETFQQLKISCHRCVDNIIKQKEPIQYYIKFYRENNELLKLISIQIIHLIKQHWITFHHINILQIIYSNKKMKFLIKYKDQVKVYEQQIQFERLCTFIEEQFPQTKSFILNYKDNEDDLIMITSNQDLSILKKLNNNQQYMTLILNGSDQEINVQQSNSQSSEDNELQRKYQSDHEDRKDSQSDNEIKQNKNEIEEQQNEHLPLLPKKIKKQKFAQALQNRFISMIDQRVKQLIPGLIYQVKNEIIKKQSHQQEKKQILLPLTICKICFKQINTIRYKCLECINFQLCENCQKYVEHQHNLLKIKHQQMKITQIPKQNNTIQKFIKDTISKKIDPLNSKIEIINKKMKNQQKQKKQKNKKGNEDQKYKKKDKEKEKSKDKDNDDDKIKKRYERFCKTFGQTFIEQYKPFIKKHLQLKIQDALNIFAQEHKLNLVEKNDEVVQKKIKKLGQMFNNNGQKYRAYIQMNPKITFNQLLFKLKQLQIDNNEQPKYKESRTKFKSKKNKLQDPPALAQHFNQQNNWIQFPTDQNSIKMKLINQFKELFNEKRKQQLFKFINSNFNLGRQKIIDQWLTKIKF